MPTTTPSAAALTKIRELADRFPVADEYLDTVLQKLDAAVDVIPPDHVLDLAIADDDPAQRREAQAMQGTRAAIMAIAADRAQTLAEQAQAFRDLANRLQGQPSQAVAPA